MPRSSRIRWQDNSANTPSQQASGNAPRVGVAPSAPRDSAPLLDQIGRDLTRLAREGRLEPVFGREDDLRNLQRILLRKNKNNPLIVGAPGVGKTALVEGLALLIVRGQTDQSLRDLRIIELSAAGLVSGTAVRGSFEARLQEIVDEASRNRHVILFIDEIHSLIRAGAVEGGALDAANILKPALARGDLHCIGATTLDEFDRFLKSDPAFERRFEPLVLTEPTVSEAVEILSAARQEYETHHRVKITDDAIRAAVELSVRYIHDRFLPDKAFDLLDNACTFIRLPGSVTARPAGSQLVVDDQAVSCALAEKTGIPTQKLSEDLRSKLTGLEDFLNRRIIGQRYAMKQIALSVQKAYAGLVGPSRPKCVLAFIGGTGVGKTETAKALAEFLFDSADSCIRLDMSEYKESFTISRLWGSPPGYIGYDDEGTFATRLRRQRFAVVLLDEFEKAHPQVHDAFLQIFDEGMFTDSRGRTVDAREAIFVLTSNLFAFGELRSEQVYQIGAEALRPKLSAFLRPELINRIDELVP